MTDQWMNKRTVLALEAIAEQLRIANLIALARDSSPFEEAMYLLRDEAASQLVAYERTPATPNSGPDDVPVIRDEIRRGLGL